MNIIGGRHRGRRLRSPKGRATRPVLGRVRESLFGVLGDMSGLEVLDLFTGTGAVGIEALSRGAVRLTAVEKSTALCRIIRENLDMVGEAGEVVRDDVFKALVRFSEEDRAFSFVFADPPYKEGLSQRAVLEVTGREILGRGGLLAVTVRKDEIMPGDESWEGTALPGDIRIVFDRRYGDTRLVIYVRKG